MMPSKTIIRQLIFILMAVLFMSTATILPVAGQSSRIRFDHLTPADGLSQSIVYDILESREGYLWFATRDGLNRYDGHRFKVYRRVPRDTTSLSDSKVRVLLEDRDGAIWAGTVEGGLNRLESDTETFTRYPLPAGTPGAHGHGRITAMVQDTTGLLWIGTYSGGLFSLDPENGRFTSFLFDPESAPNVPGAVILDLHLDSMGRLWVVDAHRNGLCLFDIQEGKCVSRFLKGLVVLQVMEGERDQIWAVGAVANAYPFGSTWAIHFDSRTGDVLEQHLLLSAFVESFDIEHGPDQDLWVAGFGGLIQLDPSDGKVRFIRRDPADPSGLSHDDVLSLLFDRTGTMWVGTPEGLDIYRDANTPFNIYRGYTANPFGLSDSPVNALLETRDGNLWLGTGHGLDRIDRITGSVTHYVQSTPPGAGPRNINRIWSLLEDQRGNLWVGTGGSGLHRFDRSTESFTYERGLSVVFQEPDPSSLGIDNMGLDVHGIRALFEDSEGFIWIGTAHGLARRDPSTGIYTAYVPDPLDSLAISDAAVNIVHEDKTGRIWIGTDYGLNLYDSATGHFSHFIHDPADVASISANVLWTIAETPLTPGILWIGTIGGGLNRFDPSTGAFRAYTTADGLPNDTVYGVLSDESGDLWMSTGCGLARFNPISEVFTTYHPSGLVRCDEFDLMSYHKSARTGEMFFGEANGFDSFFPGSVRKSDYVPPIVLTGVKIFDTERPGLLTSGDTLSLGNQQNYFTISFAALDFTRGTQNLYRYHLDGYDEQWRTSDGSRPEASYTDVPPGDYTFRVMGSNKDGVFSTEVAELHVVIVPALWQTAWFRLLATFLALGTLGILLGVRQSRERRRIAQRLADADEVRQRLAEREELERVRLARELHDGPIQGLYHVNHMLEALSAPPEPEPGPNSIDLDAPRDAVNQLAVELRDLCNELRPPMLQHFGLRASIEECITRSQSIQPKLKVRFDFDSAADTLPDRTQHVIFRSVQEAIHNIIQHAEASLVRISISVGEGDIVFVLVDDDGKGFVLPGRRVQLARRKHLGLIGMMERSESVGGTCTITSTPGSGTNVRIAIPSAVRVRPTRTSWRDRVGQWIHKGVG